MENKSIIFTKRPNGIPTSKNFYLQNETVPSISDGEILLELVYVSVDPYLRGRMNDVKSYISSFEVGKAMMSGAVVKIIKSKNDNFSVGSHL